MTMLKKTLLASAAIAVMTGLVGCGDDPVATKKPDGGDTTITGTYTDTIYAMTVVHPNGWTKLTDEIDPAVSSVEVSGIAGEDATVKLVRGKKPKADESDPWPEATILGAMFEDGKSADYSLAKMKQVIVSYTVTSFPEGADGISFSIGKEYSPAIEAADWAKFHAVLTTGSKTVGTQVWDTLELADFHISYGSTLYDSTTTLATDKGLEFLKTANNFAVSLESEKWDAAQTLELKLHDVQIIGETGLKTEMKIAD